MQGTVSISGAGACIEVAHCPLHIDQDGIKLPADVLNKILQDRHYPEREVNWENCELLLIDRDA